MTTTLSANSPNPVPNLTPGAVNGAWDVMLRPPADLPALRNWTPNVTGTPATAWATGTKVTLGDGTDAHWTGTLWAAGPA